MEAWNRLLGSSIVDTKGAKCKEAEELLLFP